MKSDFRIKVFASNSLRLALGLMLVFVIAAIAYLFVVAPRLAQVSIVFLLLVLFYSRRQLENVFQQSSQWEIVVRRDFSLELLELGLNSELISTQSVIIESTSKLWPFLISLDFRCEDGRRLSLCVMRDAMSQTDFRRLKVVLQFAKKRFPSNILALDQQ